MTRRFRLLAGPNGSGKTTLKRRLERDYVVNFYDSLNADEIFAEVKKTGAYAPRLAFETSAEAASREAVNEAFAAGLPITVLQNGRVVRVKGGAL